MVAIKPMLACSLPGDTQAEKLAALDKLPYPLLASYKLDGIRCLTTYDGPQTRSGEPIPNLHIRSLLGGLPAGLDGELVCLDKEGHVDFRLTTGNVRRASGEPKFLYRVFDYLDGPPTSFCHRLDLLEELIQSCRWPAWCISLSQTEVYNGGDVRELFTYALRRGHEGLILRNPSAPYKHGRATFKSADMIKVKPYEDAEAVIVGVFERMHNANEATKDKLGHTKRSDAKGGDVGTGMLGGFRCKLVTSPEGVGERAVLLANRETFEVSAGKTTHAEKAALWAKRDELIGKVIRFQHVTVGGYDVPRHGTFQGFREKWDMGE